MGFGDIHNTRGTFLLVAKVILGIILCTCLTLNIAERMEAIKRDSRSMSLLLSVHFGIKSLVIIQYLPGQITQVSQNKNSKILFFNPLLGLIFIESDLRY